MRYAKVPARSREEALEIHDEVQECPLCGHWYSLHSAVPCHACAVGLERPPEGWVQ